MGKGKKSRGNISNDVSGESSGSNINTKSKYKEGEFFIKKQIETEVVLGIDDKKTKKGKKKSTLPTITKAQTSNIHDLYQKAVQSPKSDVSLFLKFFHSIRGRKPISLKEDFSGTGILAAEWVHSNFERIAFCVDLDKPTIERGKRINMDLLGGSFERLNFIHDDVTKVLLEEKVDIVAALNYSFCVFKTRTQLLNYFKIVKESLVDDGIFICDIFGGALSTIPFFNERDCGDFTYIWEQEYFNPLTNEIKCHIHFSFPSDGSKIKYAFSYDWRLWSIVEIKELLLEVGFKSVSIWWKNEKQRKKEDSEKIESKLKSESESDSNSEEGGNLENDSEKKQDQDIKKEKRKSKEKIVLENLDQVSGESDDEYFEATTAKQTKVWNAFVLGIV